MKKAILYTSSQSWHAGGGLNYFLKTASTLKAIGYHVTCKIPASIDIQQIKENYEVGEFKVEVMHNGGQSLFQQIKFALKEFMLYDVIIYHANQPPRINFIRRSFILCDFPVNKKRLNFKDKIRLGFWKVVLVNSQYTQGWIKKYWDKNSKVLYPPVTEFLITEKHPFQLLSVGRFHGGERSKRQDLIIDAFIRLSDRTKYNWQLHLIGFVQDKDFLQKLRNKARGYNIRFHENISLAQKQRLLSTSSTYIHACGYGIDEDKNPELAEHFGISIVEAMAAGCIPFVIPKGGPGEIVEAGKDGFHWEELDQLVDKIELVTSNRRIFNSIRAETISKSKLFSQKAFENTLKKIIDSF